METWFYVKLKGSESMPKHKTDSFKIRLTKETVIFQNTKEEFYSFEYKQKDIEEIGVIEEK